MCSIPPDDEVRGRHLIEAASKAVAYAAGRSRDDLDDDELLRLALTKLIEIVAKRRSTSATTCAYPTLRDGSAPTARDRRCVDEQ